MRLFVELLLLGFGRNRVGLGWAGLGRRGGRGRWGQSLRGLVLMDPIRGLSQRLLQCVRVETFFRVDVL